MNLLWPALPRSFAAFVLPSRLLVLRYGLSPFQAGPLKERWEYPLTGLADLADAFVAARQRFRPSADDVWRLCLPLKLFTTINFSLPDAASRNLDQAVHYAMMSHLPFDPSEAFTHYLVEKNGQKMAVSAVAALRRDIMPYLEAVSLAGITLAAVTPSLALIACQHGRSGTYIRAGSRELEILVLSLKKVVFQTWEVLPEDPEKAQKSLLRVRALMENSLGALQEPFFLWESEQDTGVVINALGAAAENVRALNEPPTLSRRMAQEYPYEIDLIPPSLLKRRRAAFWIQAASLLVLLLTLIAYPAAQLMGKHQSLRQLEKRITEAQRRAEDLTNLREANQNLASHLRRVADHVHSQPQVGEILKEVTELLPDEAWISSFIFANGQIVLQGEAASATEVLELLENSPLFKDVRFESQIVRRKEVEMFKIAAKLE